MGVRQVGATAVTGVEKVKQLNEQHQITQKVGEIGSNAVARVKDANEQLGITDKVSRGATAVVSSARDVNERHRVSETVATGLTAGVTRASTLLGSLGNRPEEGSRTWREAANRADGNEEYQFGDVSRSLWHKARALIPSAQPAATTAPAEAIAQAPSSSPAQ